MTFHETFCDQNINKVTLPFPFEKFADSRRPSKTFKRWVDTQQSPIMPQKRRRLVDQTSEYILRYISFNISTFITSKLVI